MQSTTYINYELKGNTANNLISQLLDFFFALYNFKKW